MIPRAALLLLTLAACASDPPPLQRTPVPATAPRADLSPAVVSPPIGPLRPHIPSLEDPSVLEPDPDSTDEELGRAVDVAIHKRHVFDRLRDTDPGFTRKLIHELVLDALVADEARRLGILLEDADLQRRLEAEENRLTEQVQKELGSELTLADYVQRQFGLELDEFRRWQRATLARSLYRQYVVRFLALRVDRVQVRILQMRDRTAIEDMARRVAEGADFATLALRHSEDESRKEGGLLPALRRDAKHPIVERAFALAPGEVSEVVTVDGPAGPRHYLIYCLRRMPGRQVSFADVRAELDQEMTTRPLAPSDFQAAYEQLLAAKQTVPPNRESR